MTIRCDVAIVGGGFSGTMVATHLARHCGPEFSVRLFEEGEVGRGAAYGTPHAALLLNTRVAAMSAFPDDADHFARWIGTDAAPEAFVSRRRYGDYITEIARRTFARPSFEVVRNRVIGAQRDGDGYVLMTASGARCAARAVVLATGNFTPNDDFLPREIVAHPGYVGDPWRYDYTRVGGHVLLVGSGLTALDALVALEAAGHRGVVDVVSRHARFPEVHAEGLTPYDVVPVLDAGDARGLLRSFRRQVREASARGYDWRTVVEAVRPEGEAHWRRLPALEQRRFDRHLRSIWERHRHRAPGQVAAARDRFAMRERLRVHAGRVAGFCDGGVVIATRARQIALRPDWIVNCTGPGKQRRIFQEPLLAQLAHAGDVVPEQLGLGVRVDAEGAVIGTDGNASRNLWVVGPLARGSRFESTAVPELRLTARSAAMGVLESIAADRQMAAAEA